MQPSKHTKIAPSHRQVTLKLSLFSSQLIDGAFVNLLALFVFFNPDKILGIPVVLP